MKINKIEGLVAAPFTPFDEQGNVNLKMVGPYASLLARNGVAGAFVCGSSGEGQSMDLAERMALTEVWLKEAPKSVKVIAHVGTNSFPDLKRLLAHAQAKGAHAAGLLAPSYHKPPTVKVLADYLAEAAKAAPELPIYFYNIPSMAGVNFPVIELLEEIDGRVPNFAGVKYTYENIMDYSQCLEFRARRYDMLFGRDELLLCSLAIGAKGAVGSTYNFAAPLYLRIIERFNANDLAGANALQMKSHDMLRTLFGQGVHPLPAQKSAMRLVGIDCGDARLPLPQLSNADHTKIAKAMEGFGFSEHCCR